MGSFFYQPLGTKGGGFRSDLYEAYLFEVVVQRVRFQVNPDDFGLTQNPGNPFQACEDLDPFIRKLISIHPLPDLLPSWFWSYRSPVNPASIYLNSLVNFCEPVPAFLTVLALQKVRVLWASVSLTLEFIPVEIGAGMTSLNASILRLKTSN